MTLTQINSKGIKDSEIVNADVASNAAIDKSKLNLGQFSNSDIASNANIDQSKLNLSITNSDVASNAAIAQSKINLSITNSDIASNAAIASSKLDLTGTFTNTNIASNANISATKLSFTQAGTNPSARTVANKFEEIISVKDFGAVGNGSNNDTSAIQNALNYAAGKGKVYIPKGTYIVHDTILIPSNTHFFGSGEGSIIKMNKDIDNRRTLVRTGSRNNKRKNIVIEDMTLDFNRERWQYMDPTQSNYRQIRTNNASESLPSDPVIDDNSSSMNYGGDAYQNYESCTLCICFSENVLIKNVRALDAYKHSIDITSPKYRRGFSGSNSAFESGGESSMQGPQIYDTVRQDGYATKANNSFIITVNITGHGYDVGDEIYLNCTGSTFDGLYRIDTKTDNSFTVVVLRSDEPFTNTSCYVIQDQGSKHVTLENCYATGAGDDNITTHFSSDLLITGCTSEFPSGRYVPANSNCYEIDDGSRNVTLTNCTARGGCKGLQIKGHAYAPAPYNVTVDGLRIFNCCEGMDIKHTSWGPTGVQRDSSDNLKNLNNNWAGGNTISNPTHQIRSGNIAYTGVSPTAKNICISNVQIIAPRGFRPVKDDDGDGLVKADKQIQLYAYENVKFTNILISDGRFDLAADQDLALSAKAEVTNGGTRTEENDGQNSDGSLDQIVDVFYGANNIIFKNLSINGFRSSEKGLVVSSSYLQAFVVDGISIMDGPNIGIDFSESYGNWVGIIDNYMIIRPETGSAVSGSIGIRNYKLSDSFKLGTGEIVRYATEVQTVDQ